MAKLELWTPVDPLHVNQEFGRSCKECGVTYFPKISGPGRGIRYCSQGCYHKNRRGYKHTESTKEKMREKRKYQVFSKETREKMGSSRRGQKDSMEARLKKREARLGERNPAWKGGVGKTNQSDRHSLFYREWRDSIFHRDKFTCVHCGIRNKKGLGKRVVLNADHIKPWSLYPELRYEVENGRTLCFPCHTKTDTYGGKLLKIKKQIHG